MARLDEIDKYLERIEEGRRDIEDRRGRVLALPEPTAEESIAWEKIKSDIIDHIQKGACSGDKWNLQGGWINVYSLGPRSFRLETPIPIINDIRINNFLIAHNVKVSVAELQVLRGQVFDLSVDEAVLRIKEFIRKYRANGSVAG